MIYSKNVLNLETELRKLLNSQTSLVANKLNSEEKRTQYAKLQESINDLESDIALLKQIESDPIHQQRMNAKQDISADMPQEVAAHLMRLGAITPGDASVANLESRAKANAVMRNYLLHGEKRDIVTSTDAAGGALIAQDFNAELVAAEKAFAPLLLYAT